MSIDHGKLLALLPDDATLDAVDDDQFSGRRPCPVVFTITQVRELRRALAQPAEAEEALARSMFERHTADCNSAPWDQQWEPTRKHWREKAAAHDAAQGAVGFRFGLGKLIVNTGTHEGEPAVIVDLAASPGVVGDKAPDVSADVLAPLRLLFPTVAQAKRVADALVNAPTPDTAAAELLGLADVEDCHKLDTPERVFFYEQDFYVLSNFSAFTLQWKGRRFDTSEAAYHWEKFDGTCQEVQDMILEAPSAHAAFKLAESQKCFRRPDWDDVKLEVMRRILRAKADQHEYVRRKLLATGDRELVEDSWRDDYWGWGPNRDGQNWLGRLWMQVRDDLRTLAGKIKESGVVSQFEILVP